MRSKNSKNLHVAIQNRIGLKKNNNTKITKDKLKANGNKTQTQSDLKKVLLCVS